MKNGQTKFLKGQEYLLLDLETTKHNSSLMSVQDSVQPNLCLLNGQGFVEYDSLEKKKILRHISFWQHLTLVIQEL